jgi:hypothetical protein
MIRSQMRTDPPPPIPATARATISAFIEGAIPQNIVPDPDKRLVKQSISD